MAWIICPNCGAKRDTSGRYTSPEKQERGNRELSEEHLSGRCQDKPSEESTELLSEQWFNKLKDRLSAATSSPGGA